MIVADAHGNRLLSLAAASYVFAVVMAGTTMPTPLYPEYEQAYSFVSLTTTTLFAVYAAGVIVALVALGQASARPVRPVGRYIHGHRDRGGD
ncbi:hypothetical protein [Corynebacterium sp.]|uniref:hypothetical protein n=1 Tax=Corynebacterium sp. TaxID=1720 RepID=UPI0028A7E12D|nr:hypothetical protein [Corynebacterium sp.]